jgi:hypothetical protein
MRKIPIILGLLGVSTLLGGRAFAQADPALANGPVCKTQQSMESLFAYHEAKPDSAMAEALDSVNRISGDGSCAIETVIFEKGDKVSNVSFDGHFGDIRRISVLAVCIEGSCTFGDRRERYAAFPAEPTI